MRIAALAFGVLAGLVASLILALGGLDPAALPQLDPRQMSLISFGLFVVANFGVLGAGIVLAAPLAGVILMLIGAVGWVIAAIVLHHGPDFVMLTPPGLLAVAAILATVAFLRRPRDVEAIEPVDHVDDVDEIARFEHERELALAAPPSLVVHDDEEEDDAPQGLAVGASFFGSAGTATPLSGAIASPAIEDLPIPAMPEEATGPLRRRIDPPRQKSVFVEPDDDYEDEESGFSRFARALSSILSFGLYAALAGAAVLIFWNIRTAETARPTATRIEASASSAKTVAPVLTPSSSAPPAQVAEVPRESSLPQLLAPPTAPRLTGEPAPSSTFTLPSAATGEAPSLPGAPVLGAPSEVASLLPPADPFAAASSSTEPSTAAASAETPPAEPATLATSVAPTPYEMSPQMAAARARPAPRVTQPAATTTDTGL